MEYVEELFSRADFSKESTLMVRLKKEIFPPVMGITLDDLMRKSGVSDRNMNPTRRQDAVRRVRDNSLERKPPKKDGPTM